jgi:HSP20 family molecular chaperone IbpA
MASFFEKLIGNQTSQPSSQEEKMPTEKRTPPKKKTIKPAPPEKEAEETVKREEPKKIKKQIPVQEPLKTEEPEKAEPAKTEVRKLLAERESPEDGQLVIDVYQNQKEIVVRSALGGVKPENLDITIENNMVTIRGSRSQTETVNNKDYFLQECHWGSFSRQFVLPLEVDSSRAEASLKDGVLTVRIPKIQKEKFTKLQVKE